MKSVVGLFLISAFFCNAQYDSSPLPSPPATAPQTPPPAREALRAPPKPNWLRDATTVPKTTPKLAEPTPPPSPPPAPPQKPEVFDDDLLSVMSDMRKEATKAGSACPSDTIFILDATSSVRSIFEEYLQFILKTINGFDISETDDRVGVIVYSSAKKQKEKIPLGSINDAAGLARAIENLPFFSGITATGAALEFSASKAVLNRRPKAKLNLVVITDGYSYDDISLGVKKLHAVPNANIYAVAIGDIFVKSVLDVIAGNPDRVLTGSTSYGALVKKLKSCSSTLDQFQRKPLEPEPVTLSSNIPMKKDDKGRNLIPNPALNSIDSMFAHDQLPSEDKDVQKEVKTLTTKESSGAGSGAEPSFSEGSGNHNLEEGSGAPVHRAPVTSQSCQTDVAIVIDASGSLERSYETQLKLATQIIEQLPVSKDGTRVALIKFAGKNKSRVFADFAQGTDKDYLRDALSRSVFISGTTYINEALELTAETIKKQGRVNARKIVVLFSDGYSADNTSPGIAKIQNDRIEVFTVGVALDNYAINQRELQKISGDASRSFSAQTFTGLLSHLPTMVSC